MGSNTSKPAASSPASASAVKQLNIQARVARTAANHSGVFSPSVQQPAPAQTSSEPAPIAAASYTHETLPPDYHALRLTSDIALATFEASISNKQLEVVDNASENLFAIFASASNAFDAIKRVKKYSEQTQYDDPTTENINSLYSMLVERIDIAEQRIAEQLLLLPAAFVCGKERAIKEHKNELTEALPGKLSSRLVEQLTNILTTHDNTLYRGDTGTRSTVQRAP